MTIFIAAQTAEARFDRVVERTWYSIGDSHLIKTVTNGPIYGRRVSFMGAADEAHARSLMGLAEQAA